MFDTYGPFDLDRHDGDALDDLFTRMGDENPRLQYGIGVYIVAAKNESGELIPWYVGRTENEFGRRILTHYKLRKFVSLLDRGPISFFLLPRATSKGKVKSVTEKVKQNGLKSIRQLEFALIGACLKLNPALLNKQEATFHNSMHVAGYLDKGPADRYFPAAKALSKLLKT